MALDPLLPSLIDRLALGPDGLVASGGGITDEQLRVTVLRDLSWLLNTTHLEAITPLDDFDAVRKSVLNYGIGSLAGRLAVEVSDAEVAAAIAKAISTFEPRLRDVRVSAVKTLEGTRESIVLTIDAELLVRPLRDIRIRGVLDLDRHEISLERAPGAR
jgi:type VI secretion system protein ImpF